jgi:hypothetical protein
VPDMRQARHAVPSGGAVRVDDDGRIFCTTHGREEESRYAKVWTTFWAEQKKGREARVLAEQ